MTVSTSRAVLLCAALIGLGLTGCDTADLTGPHSLNSSAAIDIVTGDDVTTAATTVDLIAGQNTTVGTVEIVATAQGGEDGYLVTYQTLAGYCISEWHLDAGYADGNSITGIPVNGGGNPKIGKFAYGANTGCLSTVEQFIPASEIEDGEGSLVFAAHAVVTNNDEDCNYIYGIASDGNIYKIGLGDVATAGDETETLFFETGLNDTATRATWPNSLAFDEGNGRLYYSNATRLGAPTGEGVPDPSAPLYFYDFASMSQVDAGLLSRRSASGTYADGLWYVPQALDDNLRMVSFNEAGSVSNDMLVCEDFTGDPLDTPMFFGDLVYNPTDGLIYGSARIVDNLGSATFFTVDPGTCDYNVVGTGLFLTQLAFDCEGNLIGFDTSEKNYLLIDPATGAQTIIGTSEYAINDLAPGDCACVGDFNETAWGEGTSFPGRSWAMYIEFEG